MPPCGRDRPSQNHYVPARSLIVPVDPHRCRVQLNPMESLYYLSPPILGWLLLALSTELPTALREGSFSIVSEHPFLFFASGVAGACSTARTPARRGV